MNIIDYNKEFEKITEQIKGGKKKLLLHVCCAPCATACIERLEPYFFITPYFYNPNINTKEEYDLRLSQMGKLYAKFNLEKMWESGYCGNDFINIAQSYKDEKEGGKRCVSCIELRLKKTAQSARETGFDYFATTLSVSPHKNSAAINVIGLQAAKDTGVNFLVADFKKKEGYKRSVDLSKELGLYRQDYCGCGASYLNKV